MPLSSATRCSSTLRTICTPMNCAAHCHWWLNCATVPSTSNASDCVSDTWHVRFKPTLVLTHFDSSGAVWIHARQERTTAGQYIQSRLVAADQQSTLLGRQIHIAKSCWARSSVRAQIHPDVPLWVLPRYVHAHCCPAQVSLVLLNPMVVLCSDVILQSWRGRSDDVDGKYFAQREFRSTAEHSNERHECNVSHF